MKKHLLGMLLFLPTSMILSVETHSDSAMNQHYLYLVPGQDRQGSSESYVKSVLGKTNIVVPVETPRGVCDDLGQERCLSYLRKALAMHPEHKNVVIHATSEGTATALNYLAEDNASKRIQCVILEAPLVSCNSVIMSQAKKIPSIGNLPLASYWLPYCAKIIYPFYWPAGKQAIKSVEQLKRDIPLILIHSKNDDHIPCQDTSALYYALRSRGLKNVYLINPEGNRHIDILTGDDAHRPVITAILAKHLNEQSSKTDAIDLSYYQPDHTPFKAHYDDLIAMENKHTRLKYTTIASCAATSMYLLRNRIAPVLSKVAPIVSTIWGAAQKSIGTALGSSRLFSFLK